MKNLILFQFMIVILISCSSQSGQKDKELQKENLSSSNLEIGQVIDLQKAQLLITGISISNETPVNKVKPKNKTNHYILVSLKIREINKDIQLSSVLFILKDSENKEYQSPGSWGKIDLGGGSSDFEATDGATIYTTNAGDIINLIFEVPENIQPKNTKLQYNWK